MTKMFDALIHNPLYFYVTSLNLPETQIMRKKNSNQINYLFKALETPELPKKITINEQITLQLIQHHASIYEFFHKLNHCNYYHYSAMLASNPTETQLEYADNSTYKLHVYFPFQKKLSPSVELRDNHGTLIELDQETTQNLIAWAEQHCVDNIGTYHAALEDHIQSIEQRITALRAYDNDAWTSEDLRHLANTLRVECDALVSMHVPRSRFKPHRIESFCILLNAQHQIAPPPPRLEHDTSFHTLNDMQQETNTAITKQATEESVSTPNSPWIKTEDNALLIEGTIGELTEYREQPKSESIEERITTTLRYYNAACEAAILMLELSLPLNESPSTVVEEHVVYSKKLCKEALRLLLITTDGNFQGKKDQRDYTDDANKLIYIAKDLNDEDIIGLLKHSIVNKASKKIDWLLYYSGHELDHTNSALLLNLAATHSDIDSFIALLRNFAKPTDDIMQPNASFRDAYMSTRRIYENATVNYEKNATRWMREFNYAYDRVKARVQPSQDWQQLVDDDPVIKNSLMRSLSSVEAAEAREFQMIKQAVAKGLKKKFGSPHDTVIKTASKTTVGSYLMQVKRRNDQGDGENSKLSHSMG